MPSSVSCGTTVWCGSAIMPAKPAPSRVSTSRPSEARCACSPSSSGTSSRETSSTASRTCGDTFSSEAALSCSCVSADSTKPAGSTQPESPPRPASSLACAMACISRT
ncbi:hypothetical protein CPZ87_21055 [Piscinibacter gummiphilus]|nr:hypothetical protein CPZ87_21055 [Piscinibacter gummiphilus]